MFIDIPLYYNRWRDDNLHNKIYYSFFEGLEKTKQCVKISGAYEDWVHDFSWMLGYFSCAVWVSIWLMMQAPRLVTNATKSKTK